MSHTKILFSAVAMIVLAGSPLASAAPPDKSLTRTDQRLRPVTILPHEAGLRIALQVRDYCTTSLATKDISVYCSGWESLGRQRRAHPLTFTGVQNPEDEKKAGRLEGRSGTIEHDDNITVSVVLTEPFNGRPFSLVWLARKSSSEPSGWLFPASELGRLLLTSNFLDSSPPAASLTFKIRVESATHGPLEVKGGGETQTVRVRLKQDDNQAAWICAGASDWHEQKLLGGLEDDDSGRPSLQRALSVAQQLRASCKDVADRLVQGSCPALSQLVGPWDGPTLSQHKAETGQLLQACDPSTPDSIALRSDLGRQLAALFEAAGESDEAVKLDLLATGQAFEARWGKLLPDDELLQAGRDLANTLTKELQTTFAGHLKANRFGAAETIEIGLSGLDETWDTSADERFEESLLSAIVAQIKGKDSAAVGAALDLLTEQLGPRAGEVQSTYQDAVSAQVDAATVAADYEALDRLILSHQDHLGPGWVDDTQETSRVIRQAKAFDEIDAALTKADIKALQKTRLRHEAVLGPSWAAEVEEKLALLIFAELDSRIAAGFVQGAIKWLDKHQDKLPEDAVELADARARLDRISGGDPAELIKRAIEQLDRAHEQLAAALSREGAWAKESQKHFDAFKPKDDFETDEEYLKRLAVLEGKSLPLPVKHLKEPLRKLGVARNRVFITKQLSASIEKENYDVNAKVWTITVQHKAYRREQVTVKLSDLEGKKARTLQENRDKVVLEGTLILGLDGVPILHEVRVSEAGSGANGSWTSRGTVGKTGGALAELYAHFVPKIEYDNVSGKLFSNLMRSASDDSKTHLLLPSLLGKHSRHFVFFGGKCGDRYVGVWNQASGSKINIQYPETGVNEEFPADCGIVIPGGKVVALLASDGRVGLYSITTRKRIATLPDRWKSNALFTPLPDGSGLLISGQRKIENVKHQSDLPFQITYSTRNGKVLKRKSTWVGDSNYGGGRYDLAQAVGFSSDGRFETGTWTRQGEYGAKKHFRVTRWGSTKKGCHLTSVSRGSAAASLGLRAGDTLTSGPCYKVPQILKRSRAGERVTLRFTRSGKTYSRTLRLKPMQALGVQAEQRSVATDLAVDGDPKNISLGPTNSIAALFSRDSGSVELRWTGLGDYEF